MYRSLGRLSSFLDHALLPADVFVTADLGSLLDGVYVLDYTRETGRDVDLWTVDLAIEGEHSIGLLSQAGGRLVLGRTQDDFTFVTATLEVSDDIAVVLHNTRLSLRFDSGSLDAGSPPAQYVLEGTIRISSRLQLTGTNLNLFVEEGGPVASDEPLFVEGFHLSRECVSLTWREPHLQRWLQQAFPDDGDGAAPVEATVSVRALFGAPFVREVRVDCAIAGVGPRLALPGFAVTLPDNAALSLVLGGGGRSLRHLALALTFAQGTRLLASSSLAWERGEEREVQNDDTRAADAPPLLALSLTAAQVQRVTLVLVDFEMGAGKFPDLLRQLEDPIPEIDYTQPNRVCVPTPWEPLSLQAGAWDLDFDVNLEPTFTLPFLNKKGGEGQDSDDQLLQITPLPKKLSWDLPSHTVALPVAITATIGTMQLETICDLTFNWEKLAFSVKNDEGLKLLSAGDELKPSNAEHLGLRWTFRGAPPTAPETRHHYLTLIIKDYDFQLVQAPGASFEIQYGELGEEPVVFAITDFALGGNGLNLTATVKDQPAKLNGLDTRFRFQGSRLEIRDNRINDFTLMGSGPMPPDLVGDATVDVALQLAQREGRLTLLAGSARLQGDQLLHCKGTRFRFSLDAIGLNFVHENGFHLYFTLTGSAQFTLAEGDDPDGPLALLSRIKIDLVDCPLTSDTRVIGRHVKFLVELPRPIGFSFLGAFDMEIRGIGFVPQAEAFDGDGAMLIAGKLSFAQGAGDTPDPRVDVHRLLIGLPERGKIIPRIHFENLPVNLNLGAAFRLNGVVDFADRALETGFSGEGTLQIQGLPTFAAAFSFLRVRESESSPWLRAWFIYLEARQISLMVPVVQLYIREVGLGFGYRYTVASLKAVDETSDVKELIKRLTDLSRTQGDLSKRDRWAIDLEPSGDDPRWTFVARALVSQTSAAPSPLHWDEAREKEISCLFLLDAVMALRSDLTFLMAFRGWLNANYYDYVQGVPGLRDRPLLSGFVLLSPRHRRLLAHAASNPDGKLGAHPQLPKFVEDAIAGSQFSATLLVEPGLLHYELGWPNMLRWKATLGPLEAEFRGGMIFRISGDELVTGTSYLARAKLELKGEVNLGIVGARVSAMANVAFGARYIGLVNLRRPLESALYGGVGLEAHIQFSVDFWIRLKVGFIKIEKTFSFSLAIDFTAGLEIGIAGLTDAPGLRGTGTLAVSVMGRSLQLSIHVGVNEPAVERARRMTEHVLNYGLEATDVDALPAVPPGAPSLAAVAPRAASLRLGGGAPPPAGLRAFVAEGARSTAALAAEPFAVPGYTVFVLRSAGTDPWTYVVLIPQGERDDGTDEPGFLPAPPIGEVPHDFRLTIPRVPERTVLEHYDPARQAFKPTDARDDEGTVSVSWRVAWGANVAGQRVIEVRDGKPRPPGDETSVALRDYLCHAFMTSEDEHHVLRVEGDPELLPSAAPVADARVHEPSDNAFESAVRGATAFESAVRGVIEQFRGSPFFKRDLRSEYERLLEAAYQDRTTIYAPTGKVPSSAADLERMQKTQQAHQLRGVIVHDLVADLRELARLPDDQAERRLHSIAFQMGLVFRVRDEVPAWLDRSVSDEETPSLYQRRGTASGLDDQAVPVRTFNVERSSFAANPPQFQRVQPLTDARTIAIAWELRWETPPSGHSARQAEPDHHLVHYHVRRRPLDSSERELVYTVKPAATLHREPDGLMKRLEPRFQLVDHFADDSLEDLALLPPGGRSYLYTITPVDYAGTVGRPLTLVATRYPSEPPQVPANAELVVSYGVDAAATMPASGDVVVPPVMPPTVRVQWSDPPRHRDGVVVTVGRHCLIFRRDAILPVGSYGLDSTTAGPRTRVLPTTNARPLATDVSIDLDVHGDPDARYADLRVDQLVAAGVFPGSGAAWRPESFRVYLQTVSLNGVASALAPVQLLLRFEPPAGDATRREERRPGELEWLPRPVALPFLPPEEQRATAGEARVPMPRRAADVRFDGSLAGVEFAAHPAGLRCIRFRWNQGPSGDAGYPLDLNAGFELLELDVDAHPADTFTNETRLAEALRPIQEVRMLPAEEVALTPGDTLNTAQWEAWYSSAVLRAGAWYSWRDSFLEWPVWSPVVSAATRRGPFHPALQAIVDVLTRPPAPGKPARYIVDLQGSPPIQPGNLDDFLRATAATADPYGWGVLQRLGLSIALSVRDAATGEPLRRQALLDVLHAAVRTRPDIWKQDTHYFRGQLVTVGALLYRCEESHRSVEGAPPASRPALWVPVGSDHDPGAMLRHLHVELLFQPGRSVRLAPSPADQPDDLLALVQLSLRPAIRQRQRYARAAFTASPGLADVLFVLSPGATCSVVTPSTPSAGQLELSAGPDETVLRRAIEVPLDGRTTVLARGARLPTIGAPLTQALSTAQLGRLAGEFPGRFEYHTAPVLHLRVVDAREPMSTEGRAALREILVGDRAAADVASMHVVDMAPVDSRSALFQVSPDELAAAFTAAPTPGSAAEHWARFRTSIEALSNPDPGLPPGQTIRVPTTAGDLAAILPELLAWSQRFFDASAPVATTGGMATTPDGPWLATAYPRSGAPAYAAPDVGGRLTYDHLLEDGWAHNYRYYLRPFGRYDQLWHSLRTSPVLFRKPAVRPPPVAPVRPDRHRGGLDVVLERTRPVAPPLVLSSSRLDAPATADRPTPPGATWEVVIAQHPEQALVEKNQTLVRQLGFRQVAFALLRRFSFAEWPALLAEASETDALDIFAVEATYPPVPASYPAAPDHLALGAMSEVDARSLDLPERITSFQQAAQVVQWDALPFYYEHRLLLVAQTASQVSTVNEVVQRDFEYRAPAPVATVDGLVVTWPPDRDPPSPFRVRARDLSVPLRRLWESLPAGAQDRWPTEAPAGQRRTPGWVPDLEVVYQIVELYGGNVEVQAEISFDVRTKRFVGRQLGSRVRIDLSRVVAPAASTFADGRYALGLTAQPVTEIELSGSYDPTAILEPTRSKIAITTAASGTARLAFVGLVTDEDRTNLSGFNVVDRAAIDRLWADGFTSEPVSVAPANLPADLVGIVDSPVVEDCRLVWEGPMSAAERSALLALPGDVEFRLAVGQLIAGAAGATEVTVVTVAAPRGPEHVPAAFLGKVAIAVEAGSYEELSLTGPLYHVDEALAGWARINAATAAVDALRAAHEGLLIPQDVRPPRPIARELDPALAARLVLADDRLAWIGPAPTDVQRGALIALDGDAAFVAARDGLLAAIDAPQSASLAPEVPRPAPDDVPPILRGRLGIESHALTWSSPAPSDAERAALAAMPGAPAFLARLAALLELVDADRDVAMGRIRKRPRDEDLPEALEGQLTLSPTRIEWRGLLSEAKRAALVALRGDPDFEQAMQSLIAALDAHVVTVPFVAPVRPAFAAGEPLAARLVIGRAQLRVHGVLSAGEARTLRDALSHGGDRRAAARLHRAALDSGMRGRSLHVRALRGNAAPSALHPIGRTTL